MNDTLPLHRFVHEAMATTFEIVVAGRPEPYARQVSAEIFRRIDHLEGLLSRYDSRSDVSQINRLLPGQSVTVSWETYRCLELAGELFRDTQGVFDVTVGPLLAVYKDRPPGQPPTPDDLRAARARVGFDLLQRTQSTQSGPCVYSVGVSSQAPGPVTVDLGGIGKGYALDRVSDILDDWSIDNALLTAGSSSVLARGRGSDCGGWSVNINGDWGRQAGLHPVVLRDTAVSGSGTQVKGRHIVDPRTGLPTRGHLGAWVRAADAARADGLSTALMLLGVEQARQLLASRHILAALLVSAENEVTSLGTW